MKSGTTSSRTFYSHMSAAAKKFLRRVGCKLNKYLSGTGKAANPRRVAGATRQGNSGFLFADLKSTGWLRKNDNANRAVNRMGGWGFGWRSSSKRGSEGLFGSVSHYRLDNP